MDKFRSVAGRIHDAASYRDLFPQADASCIKHDFRVMARAVHPDQVSSTNVLEATEVTQRLTELHQEAEKALQSGAYFAPMLVFESPTQQHTVQKELKRFFDMTKGFAARSVLNGDETDTIIKIACVPPDNELLVAEANALKVLAKTSDQHRMFYPELIDSFVVADGRKRLRANVVNRMDGFVNLDEVRERYPNGVHPLDMGWMWRRVLWALGGVHAAGVLHGALVPSNIMIHPALHGVVLVDWCYSQQVADGDFAALKAIVGSKRDWYPKDILARTPPTSALDAQLAARSMLFIMEGQSIPAEMQRYFSRIVNETITDTVYDLLAQFDALLERLGVPYYPRTYRPLNW